MLPTDDLIKIRQCVQDELHHLIGMHWQDVQSELHLQHREMPYWILLYQDFDLQAAHRAFLDVVTPRFPQVAPMQFTVTYTLLTAQDDVTVEALMDNNEISTSWLRRDFGKFPLARSRRMQHVFGSAISELQPQSRTEN